MSIKDNCEIIQEKITRAAENAGRKADSVTLMAVSKFHPASSIIEAINAGMKVFGENRVQEAIEKFPAILEKNNAIELHLIGSLQRNKVKQIIPYASCIQSVDRLELLQEIIKQVEKNKQLNCEELEKNRQIKCEEIVHKMPFFERNIHGKLNILFEVHTGEESKAGFDSLDSILESVEFALDKGSEFVSCAGFMTMAPFTDDKSIVRNSFKKLMTIAEQVRKRFPNEKMETISMGMSNDYEIAIEEGSNLVRVGTAIFGERQYV